MRNIKILVALAMVAACGSSVWAGEFALFGSYWNTKDLDEGIGGGVRWGTAIAQSKWDFTAQAGYFPDIQGDPGPFDFEFSVLPVELGVKYNFMDSEATNVYLGAGAGYYFLNSDLGHTDDEFGWYAVGGFEAGQAKGAGFFAEALYRQMEGTVEGVSEPGNPSVETDADVNLNGLGANMGVVWRW